MPWRLSNVQDTQGPTSHVMPGFNLQQEGHSPSVTFLFENEKSAHDGRALMEQLLDKAAAIVHVHRTT